MKTLPWAWSLALFVVGCALAWSPAPWSWMAPLPFLAGAWLWRRPQVALPAPPPTVERVVEEVVRLETRVPEALPPSLMKLKASLTVLADLRQLIISDTERSVIRVTEGLFSLGQSSQDVATQIQKSLQFMNDDMGLVRTVERLEEEIRVFEALASHFADVKQGLATDIRTLTEAVRSINAFSGTLSDLADQTNVLAINASIEAARVGVHGRGFAVIAGHVQSLSKHSKDIADKMTKTIRDVVEKAEDSFDRQVQRIQESEGLIQSSETQLRRWGERIAPQIASMQQMVDTSGRLAGVLVEELGEVTVSLQFQDRVRQILDHMAAILAEALAAVAASASVSLEDVPRDLRDEAFVAASRHFTTEEEWALRKEHKGPSRQGSVELF